LGSAYKSFLKQQPSPTRLLFRFVSANKKQWTVNPKLQKANLITNLRLKDGFSKPL